MDRRSFLAALALLLSGCMPKSSGLTVGSKNFTEQLVLGELLAQYLGRFNIAAHRPALLSGRNVYLPSGAARRTHRHVRGIHGNGAGCDPEGKAGFRPRSGLQ